MGLLDLVVVNYKTYRELAGFLWSYSKYHDSLVESLTVVNVAPEAMDRRIVEKFREDFSELSVRMTDVDVSDNVGYGVACNLGASFGSAPILALLNADTEFEPGVLASMVDVFAKQPDVAVAGPRQVDRSNTIRHGGIFHNGTTAIQRGWNEHDYGQYCDDEEVWSVSGSAYFVRRSVWDELTACPKYVRFCQATGAFLPTRHYFEETWCSVHARAHGHKVMYVGSTRMIHHWNRNDPSVQRHHQSSKTLFNAACEAHGITH